MSVEDFLWKCPYKKYLGIECYGCGAQTAFLELLKGNFAEAFEIYPAIYSIILLAVIWLIYFITKKKKYQKMILPLIFLNIVIIVLQYYLH